jgi:hypothetical protein
MEAAATSFVRRGNDYFGPRGPTRRGRPAPLQYDGAHGAAVRSGEAVMLYYATKLILSALIIVVVSEVAKYSAGLGALIKSLPLISILAMIWLYVDTHDAGKISELSVATFWLVLPTLPMFLVLPALLKNGMGFYPSLGISIGVMAACYLAAIPLLARFGIQI